MKSLGLIGGISPKSTVDYYREINQFVNEKLGGHHSADLSIISLNFEEIVTRINNNQWDEISKIMESAALKLEKSGADIIAICSNTLHKTYSNLLKSINSPIVHILDPIIEKIQMNGFKKIGILGTKLTVQENFYTDYLSKIETKVEIIKSSNSDCNLMNEIIFNSLCRGLSTKEDVKNAYRILENMLNDGAEAIVLACTELPHLFKKMTVPVETLDTVVLHSKWLCEILTN